VNVVPLISVKKLQNDYRIQLNKLYNDYRRVFSVENIFSALKLSVGPSLELPLSGYLSISSTSLFPTHRPKIGIDVCIRRFYNEEGNLIREVDKVYRFYVERIGDSYYIDLENVALEEYGIPLGYYVDLIFLNFVIDNRKYTIYPNETKLDLEVPDDLKRKILDEIENIKRISKTYEVVPLLSEVGLEDCSSDISEGLRRLNERDFEGAIKFFRKAIEGLKTHLKEIKSIDGIESRAEGLRDCLSKVYGLLSNFGEHYRTSGGMDEAALAKELTIAISTYIANKIKTGKVQYKEQDST